MKPTYTAKCPKCPNGIMKCQKKETMKLKGAFYHTIVNYYVCNLCKYEAAPSLLKLIAVED